MQFGIIESIYYWGLYRPNSLAVRANGSILTYRDLCRRVDAVAHQLSELGDARVGVLCKHKLDYLLAVLAILRAGKSVVLLNPGLSEEALKVNVTDTSIHHAVVDESFRLTASRIGLKPVGLDISAPNDTWNALESLRGLPRSEPRDEWAVFFSSGSTGIPKGIERDNESVVTEAIGWCLELGLRRDTRYYISRPVYYTGGMVLTTATMLVGGCVVLNDLVDDSPERLWEDVRNISQQFVIDQAFFVPDQLRAFLRNAQAWSCPLPNTTLLVMGAPISGAEKVAVARALECSVIESWGNSESLGTITDREDLAQRPDSIGRPFLTDEMYIIGDEGKVLGPMEVGRIAGGAEAGFTRYSNRPNETSNALTEEWIISEDLGYVSEDGYFYIVGRLQDAVVRGGRTIYLSRIESKLQGGLLKELAVTSVPVGDNECNVVVFGVLLDEGDQRGQDELITVLNDKLNPEERVTKLALLPSMPRVPSGKINRIHLTEMAKKLFV